MSVDLNPAALYARLALRAPGRVSIVGDDDTGLTVTQVQSAVAALATRLGGVGVTRGDRVAYAGRNSPCLLVTYLATTHLGAVFVPLNFRLAEAEVTATLAHCEPRVVVAEPDLAEVYRRAAARSATACTVIGSDQAMTPVELGPVPPRPELGQDDLAVIMYTSGTSGRPKGVCLTHGNLFWSSRNVAEVFDTRPDDTTLAVAPMFHIGGLNSFALATLQRGGTVLVRRSFDAQRCLEDLTTRATSVFGVPAMFVVIARQPSFATADLSGVRAAIVGGAPVPGGLLAAYAERGMPLQASWGMTETAPSSTVLPASCIAAKPCSAGVPLPYTTIKVAETTGAEVESGTVGELWVRGPNVTPGYWRDEAATRAALTGDGWLRSGDLATRDADGCVTVVGRVSEVINTGGEKVIPSEVEEALVGLPGVTEVCVVGTPHPDWGETVVAVVECPDGDGPDLGQVRDLGGRSIARYKLPTRVLVVDALPRTASSKVDRRAVKALALA
jgi:fatty-acyl-CoA synthase